MAYDLKSLQALIGGSRPQETTPEGAQAPLPWGKAVVLHPPQRMNAYDRMAAHTHTCGEQEKRGFSQTTRNRGV